MIVAITGASGNMGKETVKSLLEVPFVTLRMLVKRDKPSIKHAKAVKREYDKRVEILYGDVRNAEDCFALVKDAAYVYHLAAVIPPLADHEAENAVTTNYDGTVNMVQATVRAGNTAKFVHISTVAVYGNRDENHPWGRVGDPLIPSAFDLYATSKLRAERYLLDSDLAHWVVLRQTGVLYDNMLLANISDGLMFHTPWNVPIEWVTAKDSGILMKNILLQTEQTGEKDFWQGIYNIGGGAGCRQTGYETFDDGFKLIGGSVKSFFDPDWNAVRNFHCFWFSDSDVLEERFHFRTQTCEGFWTWFLEKHKTYRAGRAMPAPVLKRLVIAPLLKNDNAPAYWKKHGEEARVFAAFGNAKLSNKWEDFSLLCESDGYQKLKTHDVSFDLPHGYDDKKPLSEITKEDLTAAAAFRGGNVQSKFEKGNVYDKVEWRCAEGHSFLSSPFTVLKGGHWCPVCSEPDREWKFDLLSKTNKHIAAVWYDTHDRKENKIYRFTKQGKAETEEVE